MPKYRVTGPDGATYDVTAPEGASEQDVMSYVQSQAGKKKEAAPSSGFGGAFKTVEDIVRSLTSGVTRGFADEIRAGADANLRKLAESGYASNLYSNPFKGEEYEAALATERERDKEISPWIRIPGEAIGLAATSMTPAGLGSAIAQGAGQGALYGFGSGEGGFASRAQSAGIGAGLGAAGGAAGHGLSRLIQPRPTPDIKALTNRGVTPTMGQIGGKTTKALEEKATSIPVLGDAIKAGQRRAIESFDVAAINEVLKPAGLRLPKAIPAGREAIRWAGDSLGKSYDDVLSKMSATVDDPFRQDMAQLSTLSKELPLDLQRVLFNKLKNLFGADPMKASSISGERAKTIVSSLGSEAAKFGKSQDAFQRSLGELYGAARNAFNDLMKRSNPAQAARLDGLDSAWKNWVRVQIAASRTGSKEGIFTPAALNAAARQADPSVRKGAFAAGRAPMQRLATEGENVLGNVYPDSGTPGRLLPFLLGGGAAMADPATTIAAGGVGAAGMLPYTLTGQKLLAALLAGNRPQAFGPIARGVGAAGPGVAALAPLLQGRQ